MAEKQDNLALTAEEKQKVINYLEERTQAVCPVCGNSGFMIADHLVSPVVVNPSGGLTLGGLNYPMVMVICAKCHFVKFHAAVPMGLPEKAIEEKNKKGESNNG